jgi:hypothetical protein
LSPDRRRSGAVVTIIRVDKSAGRWEAVPVALTTDARLSLETRGLAAWFMTRPSNWRIQAGALSGLLDVGRDKVKRMLRELENAGYFVRSLRHDADGRWIWESTFSPIPAVDVFSVDGSPGDGGAVDGRPADGDAVNGSTVDGEGVDTRKTRGTTRLRSTTEGPTKGGKANPDLPLQYPDVLLGSLHEASSRCLDACPERLRQAVLDEVAGLAQRSRIRGSAIGLLRALVASANRGRFTPAAGIPVSRARGAADPCKPPPEAAVEPETKMSDSQREEVKRKLAALRDTLAASASRRPH